ncbi:MAG TPA: hypothetical protein VKD70_05875 [Candidatus Acidoferrum sp.]|nr:hypothetical protein [Candidatus Acidoferrum sp.]
MKTIPAGSVRNPYSRVLEGHHLSIRPASRPDRARKSPPTVESVGWLIRNATRPVFHKGNPLQKEKRTKKEKQKRPVENAAATEIREENGGLRQLFLDADSHSCLEKPRKRRSAFPHLPQGPVTIHSYDENFHLENYKGWLRHQLKVAKPPKAPQTGWSVRRNCSGPKSFAELTTPAAPFRNGSIYIYGASTLLCEEGNSLREFNSFTPS